MSLQFIIGGSGYGKSRYIYEKIIAQSLKHADRRFYFIVPEQYTVQTEKDIISLHPNKGITNIDVLSFRRLTYRVFEETGIKRLPLLDDTGKNLVLRKVIEANKDKLLLYKNKVKMPGFVEQMKSVIAELYQYGIGEGEIKAMLDISKKQPMLHAKLSDILLIRSKFQDYIEGNYITSEELLDVLADEIPKSVKILDSVFVFDGFTGFTPIQYKVINALLPRAKEVTVTVTADVTENLYSGELRETLFGLGKTTVNKLAKMAEEAGIEKKKDIILNDAVKSRFNGRGGDSVGNGGGDGSALGFLERHVFRGHKAVYEKETEAIKISEHLSVKNEAEHVAGAILSLVREKGCSFRNIAVVTGALDTYKEALEEAFLACNISYFVDYKTKLSGNPFVELIRNLFEIVRTDYSFESVFAFLKTGLTDFSEDDINFLENYCVSYGVRGKKRWSAEWRRKNEDETSESFIRVNALRESLITRLVPVTDIISDNSKNVREKMTAVYSLLVSSFLRCQERLKVLSAEFEKQGEFVNANEYRQTYKLVMELFDKVVALLGDECISAEELAGIMDSGFEELKVGIIPPSVDRVLIGDIQRSRLGGIKYLFFVGVNDGVVPDAGRTGGIISGTERNFLAENSFELSPAADARHNIFIQRFYLYLNLTKPSKQLNISYSLLGGDGSSKKPSVIVKQLVKMFPAISIKRAQRDFSCFDTDMITTPDGSIGIFIDGLSDEAPKGSVREKCFEELFAWYLRQPEKREKIYKLVDAAFYKNRESRIAAKVAASLYGPQPISSVTRLEQFAGCAYAHFLSYGLRLREPEEYEVTYLDIGNIFHYAIEEYSKKISELGLKWQEVSDEQNERIVNGIAEDITKDYRESLFISSGARSAYLKNRLKRITKRTVWALREQLKKGDFMPVGNEVSFAEGNGLSALNIELYNGKKMKLRGRIDRMDVFEDKDNIYLKIVDYKTGATKFNLSAAYYGLQLQLLIYMEAARESVAKANPGKNVIPAGMFYYNIADALTDYLGETDGENKNLLKQLCVNGLVNAQEDVIEHLDKDFDKDSDVIPVYKNRDGSLSLRSQVIKNEEYEALTDFIKDKIRTAGTEILEGNISLSPYESGGKTGCDYCGYKGVCGFDTQIKGCEFRKLKSMKADEIWERIRKEKQNGDSVHGKTK